MTVEKSLRGGVLSQTEHMARLLNVSEYKIINNPTMFINPLTPVVIIELILHDEHYHLSIDEKMLILDEEVIIEKLVEASRRLWARFTTNHSVTDSILAMPKSVWEPHILPTVENSLPKIEKLQILDMLFKTNEWKLSITSEDEIIIESTRGCFKLNKSKFIDTLISLGIFEAFDNPQEGDCSLL